MLNYEKDLSFEMPIPQMKKAIPFAYEKNMLTYCSNAMLTCVEFLSFEMDYVY